jgi:hypothetical protein
MIKTRRRTGKGVRVRDVTGHSIGTFYVLTDRMFLKYIF